MADNKTNKPLPKVEAAEDKLPMQQQFNFGQQAEDFRTDSEIQKDLLSKIFTTLLDISGNVTIISEMMPDLLSAQKSLEALRGPDRLAEQEKQQEDLARTLRGDTAKVVKDTADGAIGFFEKIFALITPFLLGFALSFVNLRNPIKLLEAALYGVVAFMTGKFIYQLGKTFVNTLLTRALDKFVGPKVINAPNSIINAGGIGSPGVGNVPGRAGRIPTQAVQQRYARRFGTEAAATRFGGTAVTAVPTAIVPSVLGESPAAATTAAKTSRMAGLASGLGKLKGFARGPAPIIIATSLLSAPSMFEEKKQEGKSTVRAGTETAAGVGGIIAGGLAGAQLGALGANPFTMALGAVIGGTVGAVVGEKVVTAFTEKVFDFFTGKDERKPISVFDEDFKEKAAREEEEKKLRVDSIVKQMQMDPVFNKVMLQSKSPFTPISKYTDQELIMAQNAIRKAKEQAPEKREATNFNIARGGDMHQQTIVNQRALEAEITKRGLGAK